MTDEFKKPLDEWIDEIKEVERPVINYDKGTGKVDIQTQKVKIPVATRYTRGVVSRVACKPKHHTWQMEDKHRHIAGCIACPKKRFLHVAYEFIDPDGHLRYRDTKAILD